MRPMENPTKFNPDTQKNFKRTNYIVKQRYCGTCSKWFDPNKRPVCIRTAKCRAKLDLPIGAGPNIGRNVYQGWYEHIDPKGPIWVESKQQLYRECVSRGKEARCLMSGGVMKRPRGA